MSDITILLKFIKILSDGNIHSSNELCEVLGIKHYHINKGINVLFNWGIDINNIMGSGYQLTKKINLLDYKIIHDLVKQGNQGNIFLKPIINSTNQYLLERIKKLRSGDVCIAEYQTAGRGRFGKYWISPFGCNLYLSLYWYLNHGFNATKGLSLVASIVIAETLNKLCQNSIKVKWPNDIYLNGRKLAGILIEIKGQVSNKIHIVIGIGINISMNYHYKENIDQDWINFEQTGIQLERNLIAGQIILALRRELVQFEKYGLSPFINRWMILDIFLHKKVKLNIGNHFEIGIEKGINQDGAILLEQHGKIISYFGDNISLRKYI
ncbi:Bifunctional ligase/repressor BirA [Candidatus Arsenophonus lipoptenae]|uniref:Bifunctional ligase/repressor BirA n=1 Tax=Candidatus Arsenophonus lipoptenae TaxID=634113 RepID=A0A0X9VSD6_9GAMM|nr:bifunctional biotin--[acetyl-CoA-carboxylase] ligase/biotin operon repressor BirA [Candidatus Arsenophonus lipoptenae]AMA64937.1 Bifunctional ligase/repressor BirA [Candidatus Arsenophonus lipoptenae]